MDFCCCTASGHWKCNTTVSNISRCIHGLIPGLGKLHWEIYETANCSSDLSKPLLFKITGAKLFFKYMPTNLTVCECLTNRLYWPGAMEKYNKERKRLPARVPNCDREITAKPILPCPCPFSALLCAAVCASGNQCLALVIGGVTSWVAGVGILQGQQCTQGYTAAAVHTPHDDRITQVVVLKWDWLMVRFPWSYVSS